MGLAMQGVEPVVALLAPDTFDPFTGVAVHGEPRPIAPTAGCLVVVPVVVVAAAVAVAVTVTGVVEDAEDSEMGPDCPTVLARILPVPAIKLLAARSAVLPSAAGEPCTSEPCTMTPLLLLLVAPVVGEQAATWGFCSITDNAYANRAGVERYGIAGRHSKHGRVLLPGDRPIDREWLDFWLGCEHDARQARQANDNNG